MVQFYKGIQLELIHRSYKGKSAKRYAVGGTNQNVWIPNKHLTPDGTIIEGEDVDYVFQKAKRQLEIAGYTDSIPGIKTKSVTV